LNSDTDHLNLRLFVSSRPRIFVYLSDFAEFTSDTDHLFVYFDIFKFIKPLLHSGQQRLRCSKIGFTHDYFDLTDVFPAENYPILTFSSTDLVNFTGFYVFHPNPNLYLADFCSSQPMATARQFARMAAVRSALELLRQPRFTPGYGLVVLGGACAPSTKIDTSVFNNIDSKNFDFDVLATPHSPLSPNAFPSRHLVVCGGVITTAHTQANSTILTLTKCSTVFPCSFCISRPRPSLPPCTDAICSVVPGRFWLWPRTGIG